MLLEEVWVGWKRGGGGIYTCWNDWCNFSCSDGAEQEEHWRGLSDGDSVSSLSLSSSMPLLSSSPSDEVSGSRAVFEWWGRTSYSPVSHMSMLPVLADAVSIRWFCFGERGESSANRRPTLAQTTFPFFPLGLLLLCITPNPPLPH